MIIIETGVKVREKWQFNDPINYSYNFKLDLLYQWIIIYLNAGNGYSGFYGPNVSHSLHSARK